MNGPAGLPTAGLEARGGSDWATGLRDPDDLEGDLRRSITSRELPVIWIDFDDLRREGVESVEVF